jgi:hypothetical protein
MTTQENKVPWKIIQCSPPRTASTVLFNIIYGLIYPGAPVDNGGGAGDEKKDIIITHDVDIDRWSNRIKNKDLYFISSERPNLGNKVIRAKYYDYENTIQFQYEELNATEDYTVRDIVTHIHDKLYNFLPKEIKLDKESAIERIKNMNKLYEEIRYLPFSHYDKFYHLHGSHRNRG